MSSTLHTDQLIEGFTDAVQESQDCFRSILKAMSEPGLIESLHITSDEQVPCGFEPATWILAQTLFDADTRLWLSPSLTDHEAISSNLRFHCQASITETPAEADFALCGSADIPPLDHLNWGSPEYPDQSTTLIIQTASINTEPHWQLSGPGIPERRFLRIAGLTERFQQELIASRRRFPRGVDCMFTCNNQLAALPRSTQIITGEL